MYKIMFDWLISNYELYFTIGFVFAIVDIYATLKSVHEWNRYNHNKATLNGYAFALPLFILFFYPLWILICCLNRLAKWK